MAERMIPEQIDVSSLNDYLEVMTMAVFQAGVRWADVHSRWPAFQECFENFDVKKVASFTEKDVDRLAENPGILRSRRKIAATITNAQTLLSLDKEFGGFANYLHSKEDYKELSKDIQKRFKYVGELSVYYLLFRVKEPVPPFEDWIQTIEGHHPRMAEMVKLAETRRKTPC